MAFISQFKLILSEALFGFEYHLESIDMRQCCLAANLL